MARLTRTRLAAVAVLAALVTACGGTPAPQRTSSNPTAGTPPPAAIATYSGPFNAGPVAPPETGAYVGAWVKPGQFTQPGRVEAVGTLESALGRRLDLINTYRRFEENFGTASDMQFVRQASVLMVSWASGDTRSITMGRHDDLIRAQARRIKAAGEPILLRFRWEMDRPNLQATMWSPEDFVAAWRHVRHLFEWEGVRNVSWVWCPTAEGFAAGRAPAFYPGDDAVDWICVDVYAASKLRPMGELLAPFLSWAANRTKPIIIGEFGVARAWGSTQRAAWLREAARVFKANPQIKAVSYFESDPEGNGVKQQFRVSDDPPALAGLAELARDPYFNPRAARHRR
jgi:hypothetical protein